MIVPACFAAAALLALFGLYAVALHDVPKISGTVALIITLAALGVAMYR
ncbi:hypothetical protein PV735_11295 [Streptomyces turgidiscabies]|uniref:Uncharacterized protein n=1 Tax=Streptomyces turgidiscabies (strain Car8) TaxID=698760 RepID=L7ERU0_STRT8|nr:hypothetical protein [Streptomyces turgidiscabies]ELP61747.1 hypothetical protein STRTUCAR8_06437 [Streptomyces turgidiscabies Car8]MDX3493269.1 hypothetical protein [Streptomyces turgidiscabies]GAQ70569.1 hypothetical protein T45_02305 [Streptomyces turgidiscabies]